MLRGHDPLVDGHQYTAEFEAPGGKPVLKVYPDPKTHRAPWTVGIGHTGPDVKQGETWTEERCWHAFYNDYAQAQSSAAHLVGTLCWASLNEPRRAVLTDMAFQMGAGGLADFRHMLDSIRAGNWPLAAHHMLDSDYARELREMASDPNTETRADKNARTLETGHWPEPEET